MRKPLALAAALLLNGLKAEVGMVVEHKIFHTPGQGPRVEVSMAILAGTVALAPNAAGLVQARVEALTLIERDGRIVDFRKTEVLGPERTDSLQHDLLHQEIFQLAPGSYDLLVELRDLNSPDTSATRQRMPLAVGALPAGISISDLLLAERIERAAPGRPAPSGYWPVPLISDYLPASLASLGLYAEVYGTDSALGSDSLFLLTAQIEDFEHRRVHGAFKRSIRAKGAPVVPLALELPIAELPSGNYLAVVEARDRKGDLLARRELFFQRNNPVRRSYDMEALAAIDLTSTFAGAITDRDTLAEHLLSMRPIADPLEQKIIDDRWKDRDMDLMRRFFYSFWLSRNGTDPEGAWRAYREEVVKVNKLFGCRVMKGYQTDRGIVYLKYGPPNSMMDRFNEMDAYPYTIWHYYRAGRFANRRFVFYQRDLASTCLELLHSEVPGEIQNPRWNQIIHSRNVAMPNVDPAKVDSYSGERANEFYQLPR
ncbi:MAG: GWxTD domain-containing protein [Flavobacteriales bacterium]